MSDKVYPVPAAWKKRALVDEKTYKSWYADSVKSPEKFWAKHAKRLDWFKAPTKIKKTSFDQKNVSIKWFEDGVLNVSYNCVDRHLKKRGDQTAIIWEGDNPYDDRKITYRELHEHVCRFANVLKANGVKKGDRVTDLPADDSGSRLCHVGMRARWSGAFHRVWRFLAGFAGWPRERCEFKADHHG